ncbi:hypothetical protein [Streptodolium elevatio]
MTSENPTRFRDGRTGPGSRRHDRQRDALGFFARWVIMSAAFLIGSQALDWDMTDAWWALGSMAVTWRLLFALAPALRALWSYAVGLRPESVDLGTGPLVIAAAHHCCTIARAYAAQNRPKDAARVLERPGARARTRPYRRGRGGADLAFLTVFS